MVSFPIEVIAKFAEAIEKISRFSDDIKPSKKGTWTIADVAEYLGKSTSYIHSIINNSSKNGFPLPRTYETLLNGNNHEANYWLPEQIKSWAKNNPPNTQL